MRTGMMTFLRPIATPISWSVQLLSLNSSVSNAISKSMLKSARSISGTHSFIGSMSSWDTKEAIPNSSKPCFILWANSLSSALWLMKARILP